VPRKIREEADEIEADGADHEVGDLPLAVGNLARPTSNWSAPSRTIERALAKRGKFPARQ
jgi:hypothetical protein